MANASAQEESLPIHLAYNVNKNITQAFSYLHNKDLLIIRQLTFELYIIKA